MKALKRFLGYFLLASPFIGVALICIITGHIKEFGIALLFCVGVFLIAYVGFELIEED